MRFRARARGCLAGLIAALAAASAGGQQATLPDTLDLERAVRIAMEGSPELASFRAQADAAGASQRAAWGAFLPRATAGLALSRTDFTRTTFVGEEGESETLPEPLRSSSQGASQSLSLSWTVLDGGRRFADLRRQSAGVRAAQRRLDDRVRAVAAATRRAFFEALRRQRLLELTTRQIEDRRLELDIARRRYQIAAVERPDVLATESNLINAEVSLLSERRQHEDGLRALAVAMGLPPDAGLATTLSEVSAVPDPSLADADALVGLALGADPELLALDADRAAASAALWGARTSYLPTIQLNLGWSRSEQFGPEASFLQFDLGDTGRSFSVSASWNLFDGFAREEQTALASSQRRQAEEGLRLRRLEIEREVRRFVAEIDQLAQTIALFERALALSQERLAMTREMYRLGNIDFTALQQAISSVTEAERSLIERQYDYLVAWSNLEEYVGGAAVRP